MGGGIPMEVFRPGGAGGVGKVDPPSFSKNLVPTPEDRSWRPNKHRLPFESNHPKIQQSSKTHTSASVLTSIFPLKYAPRVVPEPVDEPPCREMGGGNNDGVCVFSFLHSIEMRMRQALLFLSLTSLLCLAAAAEAKGVLDWVRVFQGFLCNAIASDDPVGGGELGGTILFGPKFTPHLGA